MKDKASLFINFPKKWAYRYTLHFLIAKEELETGKDNKIIVEELAALLGVTTRTIGNWRYEPESSDKTALNYDFMTKLAKRFKVDIHLLISSNVIQLAKAS